MRITHVLLAAVLLVSPSLGMLGRHTRKTQPQAPALPNDNDNHDNNFDDSAKPSPAGSHGADFIPPYQPTLGEGLGEQQINLVPEVENPNIAANTAPEKHQAGQLTKPSPFDPLKITRRIIATKKPSPELANPPRVANAVKRFEKEGKTGFLVMLDSLIGTGIVDFPLLLSTLDPNKKLQTMKEGSILREELEYILAEFENPAMCHWDDLSVGLFVEREVQAGPAQNRIQEEKKKEEKKEEKSKKGGKGKGKTGVPMSDKVLDQHNRPLPNKLPCDWNTDINIRAAAILTEYLQQLMVEYDGKSFISKNEPVPHELMQKLRAAKSTDKKKKKAKKSAAQEKSDSSETREQDLRNEVVVEEVIPIDASSVNDIDTKQQEENAALYYKIRDELDIIADKQRKQNIKTLQASYKILLKSISRSAAVEIMTFAGVALDSAEILKKLEKDGLHMVPTDCYAAFNFINEYIARLEKWRIEIQRYSERAAQILPPQQRSMEVNEAELALLEKDKTYEVISPWIRMVITKVVGNKVTPTTDIKLGRIKIAGIVRAVGDILQLAYRFHKYIEYNLVESLKAHQVEITKMGREAKNWAGFEKNLRILVKNIKSREEFFPTVDFLTTWVEDADSAWFGVQLISMLGGIYFAPARTFEQILQDKKIKLAHKHTRKLLDSVVSRYEAVRSKRKTLYDEMFKTFDILFKLSREYLATLYKSDEKVLKEYADEILQGKVDNLAFTNTNGEESPAWMNGHIMWFDAEEYLESLLAGKAKSGDMDTVTIEIQSDFQKKRKTLTRERERWMKKSFIEGNPVTGSQSEDDVEVNPSYIPYLTRWKQHNQLKSPTVSVLDKIHVDRDIGVVYLKAFPEMKKNAETSTAKIIPASDIRVLSGFHQIKQLHEHFDRIYEEGRPIVEERLKVLSNEVSNILKLFVENASLRENAKNAIGNQATANFFSHVAGPLHIVLDFQPSDGAVLNGYHTDLFVRQLMAIEHLISTNADDIASKMILYFKGVEKAAKGIRLGSPDDLAELERASQPMQEIIDAADPAIVGDRIETILESTLKHVTAVLNKLNTAMDPREYWDELSNTREHLRHLKVVIKRFGGLKKSNGKSWQGGEQAIKDINVVLETIERTRVMLTKDHRSYPRPNALDHDFGPKDSIWRDSEERFGKHIDELYEVKEHPELLWWSNEYNEENRDGDVFTGIQESQR